MNSKTISFDYVKCSKRIRELRLRKGLSQEELSKKIGVSSQVLKNYEQAAKYGATTGQDRTRTVAGMSINTLCKLALFFEVTTDYLLGIDDNYSIDVDMQIASETTGLSNQSIEALRTFPECDEVANRQQMDALEDLLQSVAFWDMLASIGLLKHRISIGANKSIYSFIQDCKLSYLDVVESIPRIMDEKYNYHRLINKAWDEIAVGTHLHAQKMVRQIMREETDNGKR